MLWPDLGVIFDLNSVLLSDKALLEPFVVYVVVYVHLKYVMSMFYFKSSVPVSKHYIVKYKARLIAISQYMFTLFCKYNTL